MKLTWILVADKSRARILNAETASRIKEIIDLTHPEGRLHEQELTTDLPGKDANKGVPGKHAFQDKIEPKQQEAIDFAKRIAKYIDEAQNEKKFEQLMIVAEPSFLGILRKQFTDEVKERISFELDKNITTHSIEDIRKHLPLPFSKF